MAVRVKIGFNFLNLKRWGLGREQGALEFWVGEGNQKSLH